MSATLLLSMILFPLIGSILNGLVLRPKEPKLAGLFATISAGLSFVCALSLWIGYLGDHTPVRISFNWFNIGNLAVAWGFAFDSLTAIMALVVTGIGTAIHAYSIGYMSHEEGPHRYFAYLNLFLFNMLLLITGDNLPVLFTGWEGVGLCSYLLIGYWYEDLSKSNAGMKAFIANRVGDAGFLLGIFLLYQMFGSVNFQDILKAVSGGSGLNLTLINLATLFLFIGATGKSAQIPLYVWLPDAMAGPTPVSALIHAATMVTAGIYLIARLNPLFALAMETSHLIAWIGALTALFAAFIAVAQRDIKKVLAYSTVSQLGLMFLGLGVGQYVAAVFHLMTHAFFKALLFLGSGSVIHALSGEQDIFNMGGLRKKLPWTFATFAIGTAAICGLPPLAGFFSKDALLYGAVISHHNGFGLWLVASTASLLTAFYMTRLFILTFLGEYRGHAHPHESPAIMTIPLAILAVGSIFAGFLNMPHDLHLLPPVLTNFLAPQIPVGGHEAHGFLSETGAMLVATMLAVVGIGVAFAIYLPTLAKSQALAKALRPIHAVLENKFYVDELYDWGLITPWKKLSQFLAGFIDPKIIDGTVLFTARICQSGSNVLSSVQHGSSQSYLLIMFLGAAAVLWLMLKGRVF